MKVTATEETELPASVTAKASDTTATAMVRATDRATETPQELTSGPALAPAPKVATVATKPTTAVGPGLSGPARRFLALALDKRTTQAYERNAKVFLKWCEENGWTDPTEDAITSFLANQAEEKRWSAETAKKHRSALAHYFKVSGLKDLTKGSQTCLVIRGIAKARPKAVPKRAIDPEPLLSLFRGMAENEELETNELLGKVVALGELLGLRMADLVTMGSHGFAVVGGGHDLEVEVLPKETHKLAWRRQRMPGCPDNPKLCFHCILMEYMERRPKHAGELVFCHAKNKTRLSVDFLSNACSNLILRAGLPSGVHPHDLRSAGSSRWRDLMAGAILETKRQFRWSEKTNTAERHYLKWTAAQSEFISSALFAESVPLDHPTPPL